MKIIYLFILFNSAFISAQQFVIDGVKYNVTNTTDKTVEIIPIKDDPFLGTEGSCFIGNLILSPTVEDSGIIYTITNISKNAFAGCTDLTAITLPNTVVSIGNGAFSFCSNLTSINIPNTVATIGSAAFSRCSSLTSVILPSILTTVETSIFEDCTKLESISIPDSVLSIKDNAFQNCNKLLTLTIPNSTTTIGNSSFRFCTSLATLNIGNSLNSIGSFGFASCTSLKTVKVTNNTPQILTLGGVAFLAVDFTSATLIVPKSTKTAYETTAFWQDFGTIIEEETLNTKEITFKENLEIQFSQNNLFVQAKNGIKITTIELINLTGQSIKKTTSSILELGSITNGVYILKVNTNKGVLTKKIIKQ